MHNFAVIRLIDEELVWYPPGAGNECRPLDSPEALQALRDLVAQQRLTLCFAAPARSLRLLEMDISAEEKKHFNQSLPFMLEEQVAEDIDGLHFAAAPLEGLRYGVALCRREAMDSWQQLLADLGLVNQWLPEPLLLPRKTGEWCLLLEAEQAILRSGDCQGFGCERQQLPMLLEAAVRESAPESLIVYGSDQAADCALIPSEMHDKLQWRRGNLCSALLLVKNLPTLNLRQGDYAARLPLQRWWREWRLVASVFAAVFCLQLLATYMEYRAASAENLALRSAREASYRQAYPQGAIVDPEKQLQRQLDSMRGSSHSGGFVTLMERVGKVLSQETGTLLGSINYNDRSAEMRMNIVAQDFQSVERVRAALNANGLVATMESSSAQSDGVRARIRVGTRG